MANTNLSNAKSAKNDEFYTQYADIQKEVNAYLDYDPDVFRGKMVLLPCDDPEWSNFTKFFAQNFERFGLKKLISTSYAAESKKTKGLWHYDNYEAIEVPFTDAIPSDYPGVMGVPKSFLDKYCPEQFEIVGCAEGDSGKLLGLKPFDRSLKKLNPSLRDGQLYYLENGMPVKPYARILIRHKKPLV